MTIVVTIKVNDGVVVAADSAASFFDNTGHAIKIYNNANKIFNLVKKLPIGAAVYGAGGIGASSISTLSKDLRRKLSDPNDEEYGLDLHHYTIEEVANKARRFLFEEAYVGTYDEPPEDFQMGYRVCGYSAGQSLAEVWEFHILGSECTPPLKIQDTTDFGARWAGQNEALDRLVLGCSGALIRVLVNRGMTAEEAGEIYLETIRASGSDLIIPAMPIQDAIDLAKFLVDTASKFTRYELGPETIGGPIEIAAITRHEWFKWVERKHYYSADRNRETDHA